MITRNDLWKVSQEYYPYTGKESTVLDMPRAWPDVPLEYQDKTGKTTFDLQYLAIIEDCKLLGPTQTATKDGDIILDSAYNGRIDLWERNLAYWHYSMQARKSKAKTLPGVTLSLANIWCGNYYHWILDQLPKLEAAEQWRQTNNENIRILLHRGIEPWHIDSLKNYWSGEIQIADSMHYRTERSMIITTRRENGIMLPSALRYLKKGTRPTSIHSNPRIYITRKHADRRRVTNEEAIIDKLLTRGFSILALESIPWREQVDIFQRAEIIIAPHGAGLANIVWCKKKPKVIELITPRYTNPCIWTIAASLGYPYYGIVGEPKGIEDMEINVEKMLEAVDE